MRGKSNPNRIYKMDFGVFRKQSRWCSLKRQANIISRILISVCVAVRSKEPGGDMRDAALLMTSGGSVDEPPPSPPHPN